MLILSRQPGEVITIGPGIKVEILGVRGKRVKVGVTAPSDVKISRTEPKEKEATT